MPEYQARAVPLNKKARQMPSLFEFGAGERVRTVDLYLGKVPLYQLSYTREGCLS